MGKEGYLRGDILAVDLPSVIIERGYATSTRNGCL